MSNKIILLLALMVIIAGALTVYFWQTFTNPTGRSNLQNIILTPVVKGCAETDKGMASRSLGRGKEQEPKIEVSGNTIFYSRAINHLCCRKVEIEKDVSNSVINIYEVWSGIGCKCMCFSEIKARLQNIPSGVYRVNVYEKGTKPASGGPLEQKLIISQNITVR